MTLSFIGPFLSFSRKFLEASMRDLDRFQRQKTKDLKEIFTNYAIMQIKQCKKVFYDCSYPNFISVLFTGCAGNEFI